MSGIFTALHTSASALAVFSQSLGAEQQNVTNSATAGYAAKRVRVTDSGVGGITASDTVAISSSSDTYADALVRNSSSEAGAAASQSEVLGGLNQLFDITGNSGVLAAFQNFSSTFSKLSVTPSDAALRTSAIGAGQQVAQAFGDLAASLDTQRAQTDTSITETVQKINTLSGQIAQLNQKAQSGVDTDTALRQALDDLSNLVDINVGHNPDGSVNVTAGGQVQLVSGNQSYALSAVGIGGSAGGGLGQVTIQSSTGESSGQFSGSLGGLLNVRNNILPGLLGGGGQPGSLNQLAQGFAARANTILTGAATSSAAGAAPGVALFTFDSADPTDAARSLQAAALTPDQLGVATTGSNGTANGAALLLSGLPSSTNTADQIGGVSAQTFFSQTAATLGQQTSNATNDQAQFQSALTSAQNSRQKLIGVSLDGEANSITADQRAYQASAQVISVLNQLTQTEVDLIK